MNGLEHKRMVLELKRVDMAREEMQFRIEERLEEIARLQDNIKIQEAKIKELKEKLGE